MANIRKRGASWAVQIRMGGQHINFTEDTLEKAEARAAWLEDQIKKGGLPEKYRQKEGADEGLGKIIRLYWEAVQIKDDDVVLLKNVAATFGATKVRGISYHWAEEFVSHYKGKDLAPGTVRKYVGALARCLDWAVNKEYLERNPLRRLPKNYSVGGGRTDQSRSRRIGSDEEAAVRRYLESDQTLEEYLLLWDMGLETAMRLQEMYTLSWEQVDLGQRTIFLARTKNGGKRQVPLTTTITRRLSAVQKPTGYVFSWFDGNFDPKHLGRITMRLSKWWQRTFQRLGIEDLHFHDLRHEATSRFFELTNLDYLEIAKITGHQDPRVLMRYANLRASTLASRLW